jgi:antitoxin VapB
VKEDRRSYRSKPAKRREPPQKGIAKLFMHGRSQAVRLPAEFRLPGDRVRVRKVEGGVLLEPITTDLDAMFAEIDRYKAIPFPERAEQPAMPADEDLFE